MLVVGPGWLGSALLDDVRASGAEAWGMRRSAAAASAPAASVPAGGSRIAATGMSGIVCADITAWDARATSDPAPALPPELPSSIDVVVLCVSPSRTRGDTHESTYPAAARGAVRLAASLGARTLLHVSSTGVYARDDGSVVSESTPVVRGDERQRALADAEDAIWDAPAAHAFGRIVLRVAGLYGPARDPASRFTNVAALADGGAYWTNFAWRDDVVSAIGHLTSLPVHDQGAHCYNCADGSPVLAHDLVRALANGAMDGAVMNSPSTTALSDARPVRARSNQRVSVDRLLETGWLPAVPDVYRGLELLGHAVRHS